MRGTHAPWASICLLPIRSLHDPTLQPAVLILVVLRFHLHARHHPDRRCLLLLRRRRRRPWISVDDLAEFEGLVACNVGLDACTAAVRARAARELRAAHALVAHEASVELDGSVGGSLAVALAERHRLHARVEAVLPRALHVLHPAVAASWSEADGRVYALLDGFSAGFHCTLRRKRGQRRARRVVGRHVGFGAALPACSAMRNFRAAIGSLFGRVESLRYPAPYLGWRRVREDCADFLSLVQPARIRRSSRCSDLRI
mmetsp:Transcript_4051/g.9583  ORF Transcript_4051/g.9583 Transcript_4051/m.9583 type:complete len:258 (-) Transcript_4051:326-1099(-)